MKCPENAKGKLSSLESIIPGQLAVAILNNTCKLSKNIAGIRVHKANQAGQRDTSAHGGEILADGCNGTSHNAPWASGSFQTVCSGDKETHKSDMGFCYDCNGFDL